MHTGAESGDLVVRDLVAQGDPSLNVKSLSFRTVWDVWMIQDDLSSIYPASSSLVKQT